MKKVRLENYHWALKASAFATCKTSALDEVGSKTMAWADRNELFNLFIMFEQCMFVSPECIVFFFTLGLSWRLDCLLSEHMDSDFFSCLCKEIWKRSHTKKKRNASSFYSRKQITKPLLKCIMTMFANATFSAIRSLG